MNCLVTGGAGFIGSALARGLLARGDAVRVLDNFSTGKRAHLAGLGPGLEIAEGDVRDPAACAAALGSVECVFHLAAQVSVPNSLRDPLADQRTNAGGTLALLGEAARAGARRFVYSGSAAAYGDNPRLPLRETEAAAPLSPYGVSKYAGELYALMFHRAFGLETVAFRYFNVYGPRQDPNSPYSGVLSKFIAALAQSTPPTLFGDGSQTRDFVYVEDVVAANLLAQSAPADRVCGKVYNIGTGRPASLLEILAALEGIFGRPCPPAFEAARGGDIRHSLADTARARTELGFQPAWSLARGLAATVAWHLSTE